MLRQGIYKAEKEESPYDKYLIKISVKETDKSFVLELLELDSRYPPAQIEYLFKDKKRVVIRKDKGGHPMQIWGKDSFTIYPFQSGVPFVFDLIEPHKEMSESEIKSPAPVSQDCNSDSVEQDDISEDEAPAMQMM